MDLVFDGLNPSDVWRGQSLQMELALGSPAESMLLVIGSFIQDAGGNWVFVVDADGVYAKRRDIRVAHQITVMLR